jgi:hypothetical protein
MYFILFLILFSNDKNCCGRGHNRGSAKITGKQEQTHNIKESCVILN